MRKSLFIDSCKFYNKTTDTTMTMEFKIFVGSGLFESLWDLKEIGNCEL